MKSESPIVTMRPKKNPYLQQREEEREVSNVGLRGCEAPWVRDASQVQLVDPLGLGVVPLREPRQLLRQRLQDAAEERGQRRRDGVHQLPDDAGAAAAHAARELLDARDVDVHL